MAHSSAACKIAGLDFMFAGTRTGNGRTLWALWPYGQPDKGYLPSLKRPDLCDFMAFNRATVLLCALAIAGCSTTPGGSETPVAGFVVEQPAIARAQSRTVAR